jgi:flagellar basal-body rod protein FlgC
MDLIRTMDIAAEGMSAQRTRLNVISANLANAHTTRTEDGSPYRRKTVIFEAVPVQSPFDEHLADAMDSEIRGVKVREIAPVKGEFKRLFDPSHPDADENGYVSFPNVDYISEMVSMLNANRSYEANAAAIKTAKEMALKALDIGR